MKVLVEDSPVGVTTPSVGQQVLSLASDALCLAATALRLAGISSTSAEDDTSCSALRGLPEYSLAEVAWHDHAKDCWIVVHDLVYDVTNFLQEHPGGDDVMLEYAGRDASLAFRSVNHGPAALRALEKCLVGRLPAHQRIFGPRLPAKTT